MVVVGHHVCDGVRVLDGHHSEDETKEKERERERVDVNGAEVLARRCVPMAQAWQVLVQALRASSSRAHRRGSAWLRDLRRALQRLAAAVMWRDGVLMPQVVNGTLETMENTLKERISERTEVVDATVPQIMKELQERIPERMQEQVVDAQVLMTVHQPGDQARRVPADLLHRQNCRYACGDAVTGPSGSDGFEDGGKS